MGVPSIILAGGKSTRMGENKSTLVWKNKTWIEHIAEALNEAKCTPIIVSVDSQDNIERLQHVVKNKDIIWVIDDGEFKGMKGGLVSSLKVAVERGWGVVQLAPCDVPMIQYKLFELFNRLWAKLDCDIIVPEVVEKDTKSGGLEPLLARVSVVPYLNKLIDPKIIDRRIVGAYSELKTHVVKKSEWFNEGIDEFCFKNCNSPGDINLQ